MLLECQRYCWKNLMNAVIHNQQQISDLFELSEGYAFYKLPTPFFKDAQFSSSRPTIMTTRTATRSGTSTTKYLMDMRSTNV